MPGQGKSMRVLRPFAAIVLLAAAAWPQPLAGAIDDIAIDAQGNILVAVRDFYQVFKIAPDGTISVFAGTGRQREFLGPGRRRRPCSRRGDWVKLSSVTVDPLTNEVYIADQYSGPQGGFQRNHHHRRRQRGTGRRCSRGRVCARVCAGISP